MSSSDNPAGAHGGEAWKKPPAERRAGDDDARLEPVGEHASRNLHESVGPEEGAQDQALDGRVHVELLADERHGDRERSPINVVDRDQQQHHQEDLPAYAGHLRFFAVAATICERMVRHRFILLRQPLRLWRKIFARSALLRGIQPISRNSRPQPWIRRGIGARRAAASSRPPSRPSRRSGSRSPARAARPAARPGDWCREW